MSSIEVRDMTSEDEYFVSTCTHESESEEAARVREVAAGFGDRVVLREYCGDDHDILLKHQIPRAIYVQGNEIGWGYEAPRDGTRDAITAALERADT